MPTDHAHQEIIRRFITLNHYCDFGENALKVLLDNAVKAAHATGKTHFYGEPGFGVSAEDWRQNYMERIGHTPIFWLLADILSDLRSNHIHLASVNNEDPVLWNEAVATGNPELYYQRYPSIPVGDPRFFN